MITRRKLLAALGLGTAAAAVASKVEADTLVHNQERTQEAEREKLLEKLRNLDSSGVYAMDDMPPITIDPSTYPRVRVRSASMYGVAQDFEYTAAEPIELGAFVALQADGLARNVRGYNSTQIEVPVGVCVEYIEVPTFDSSKPRKLFGTVESVEPDGKAWVRIGDRHYMGNPDCWTTQALRDHVADVSNSYGRGMVFYEQAVDELRKRGAA